jgi:hypothetical protein
VQTGAVHQLPVPDRHLAVDERGIGLRATWYLDRGFVNLSLWRDDRCVETFHLTPAEAGRLVNFLVSGLVDATAAPAGPAPASAPAPAVRPLRHGAPATTRRGSLGALRRDLADARDGAAARLRP